MNDKSDSNSEFIEKIKLMKIGDVIAELVLELRFPDGRIEDVEIKLGKPVLVDETDAACIVECKGPIPIGRQFIGVGTFLTLATAIFSICSFIERFIKNTKCEIHWFGEKIDVEEIKSCFSMISDPRTDI